MYSETRLGPAVGRAAIGSTIVRSNSSQLSHAAEVQSYAVSIWVSAQGLSAPRRHSCLPFSSLPGDVGTLIIPPDLRHVTSNDLRPPTPSFSSGLAIQSHRPHY